MVVALLSLVFFVLHFREARLLAGDKWSFLAGLDTSMSFVRSFWGIVLWCALTVQFHFVFIVTRIRRKLEALEAEFEKEVELNPTSEKMYRQHKWQREGNLENRRVYRFVGLLFGSLLLYALLPTFIRFFLAILS